MLLWRYSAEYVCIGCVWPPGKGSGGRESGLLCNFVTHSKPILGRRTSLNWLSRLASLLCSRSLAVYCSVASIVCRFLLCLVTAAAAACAHTYRDRYVHHECRDCDDHTPTPDWAELNWASDQTETSEKRHATVTAIGRRGRMQWPSLGGARAVGRRELHRREPLVVAFVCIMLKYKWSLARAVGGPRYMCARAHGSCQQQCHNSLAPVLAVV